MQHEDLYKPRSSRSNATVNRSWELTESLTRSLFCPVASWLALRLYVPARPPALRLRPDLTHFNVKTTFAECCREDFSHFFFFFFGLLPVWPSSLST